jgi:hypothetical protein
VLKISVPLSMLVRDLIQTIISKKGKKSFKLSDNMINRVYDSLYILVLSVYSFLNSIPYDCTLSKRL